MPHDHHIDLYISLTHLFASLHAPPQPNSDKIISPELFDMFEARVKRSIRRGLESFEFKKFVERVRRSKANCQPGEKPVPVKTHSRNYVVLPEFVITEIL